MPNPSRTFGGTSGIRVRARRGDSYAERYHPLVIHGLLPLDIRMNLRNARNLHKQLGKAVEYLEKKP